MSDYQEQESLYAKAAEELESGQRNDGLWARCFAESSGDETKAKARYIQKRVERLQSETGENTYKTFEEEKNLNENKPTSNETELSFWYKLSVWAKIYPVYVVGYIFTSAFPSENLSIPEKIAFAMGAGFVPILIGLVIFFIVDLFTSCSRKAYWTRVIATNCFCLFCV